jgi:hypothetical protein
MVWSVSGLTAAQKSPDDSMRLGMERLIFDPWTGYRSRRWKEMSVWEGGEDSWKARGRK